MQIEKIDDLNFKDIIEFYDEIIEFGDDVRITSCCCYSGITGEYGYYAHDCNRWCRQYGGTCSGWHDWHYGCAKRC